MFALRQIKQQRKSSALLITLTNLDYQTTNKHHSRQTATQKDSFELLNKTGEIETKIFWSNKFPLVYAFLYVCLCVCKLWKEAQTHKNRE